MIDLEKAIEFEVSDLKFVGEQAKFAIEQDAKKGVMQDGLSGLDYRSINYSMAKMKGQFVGQISNQTNYVDLTLTGEMWNNMTVEATNNSVTIAYSELDRHKVLRNQKWGRDIVGLNQKNIEMVALQLSDIIAENIINKVHDDIQIELGISL